MKDYALVDLNVTISITLTRTVNLLCTLVFKILAYIVLKVRYSFFFIGCDGNENNFITYSDCMKSCSDLNKNYTADAIKLNNMKEDELIYPINCMITEWTDWSECTGIEI
jgi:hypothetical protein